MSKILNVDLDDETHRGLGIIAKKKSRSMRYVAREAIKKRVDSDKDVKALKSRKTK